MFLDLGLWSISCDAPDTTPDATAQTPSLRTSFGPKNPTAEGVIEAVLGDEEAATGATAGVGKAGEEASDDEEEESAEAKAVAEPTFTSQLPAKASKSLVTFMATRRNFIPPGVVLAGSLAGDGGHGPMRTWQPIRAHPPQGQSTEPLLAALFADCFAANTTASGRDGDEPSNPASGKQTHGKRA